MSLSRKTLEHPVLILIVFALLGVVGIFTLSNVAIALMPEVENPSLSINTTYTNAGPESVEKTVTKVIENAVMSVNGLKNITSTSNESNSSVQLEFEYGTDLTEAIPAFLTILFMVCAYSISDGIMFGILSYVVIKAVSGKFKEVSPMTWVVAGLFLLKIIVKAL